MHSYSYRRHQFASSMITFCLQVSRFRPPGIPSRSMVCIKADTPKQLLCFPGFGSQARSTEQWSSFLPVRKTWLSSPSAQTAAAMHQNFVVDAIRYTQNLCLYPKLMFAKPLLLFPQNNTESWIVPHSMVLDSNGYHPTGDTVLIAHVLRHIIEFNIIQLSSTSQLQLPESHTSGCSWREILSKLSDLIVTNLLMNDDCWVSLGMKISQKETHQQRSAGALLQRLLLGHGLEKSQGCLQPQGEITSYAGSQLICQQ